MKLAIVLCALALLDLSRSVPIHVPGDHGVPEGPHVVDGGDEFPQGGGLGPEFGDLGPEGGELGPEGGELGPEGGELGPEGGELGPDPEDGELGPEDGELGPEDGELGPEDDELSPEDGELGPGGAIGAEVFENKRESPISPDVILEVDGDGVVADVGDADGDELIDDSIVLDIEERESPISDDVILEVDGNGIVADGDELIEDSIVFDVEERAIPISATIDLNVDGDDEGVVEGGDVLVDVVEDVDGDDGSPDFTPSVIEDDSVVLDIQERAIPISATIDLDMEEEGVVLIGDVDGDDDDFTPPPVDDDDSVVLNFEERAIPSELINQFGFGDLDLVEGEEGNETASGDEIGDDGGNYNPPPYEPTILVDLMERAIPISATVDLDMLEDDVGVVDGGDVVEDVVDGGDVPVVDDAVDIIPPPVDDDDSIVIDLDEREAPVQGNLEEAAGGVVDGVVVDDAVDVAVDPVDGPVVVPAGDIDPAFEPLVDGAEAVIDVE